MVVQRSAAGVALGILGILGILVCSCSTGPKSIEPDSIPTLAVETDAKGTVQIVEYAGSDIGEPVPYWMTVPTEELEAAREYGDSYLFRFQVADVELDGLLDSLRNYPVSLQSCRAVHERALIIAAVISGLPDALMDNAGRILLVLEYMGYRRREEFWDHEIIRDGEGAQTGERYRGWILVSVPRDQVHAALRLAYDTAAANHPVANDRDQRAREELLAGFRNGL